MKRLLLIVSIALILVFGLTFSVGCASAEFEVSALTITPNQAVPNEAYIVNAEVTNVGGADGVYTAVLTVNGIERTTKEINVASGTTEKISFTVTEETPGNYDIALNGLTASFKIISTNEIVNDVIQSAYNVDTYQFDSELSMHIAGVVDNEEGDITIDISSIGTVDNINRQIWTETELTLSMTIPTEETMVFNTETYIVGNYEYTLIEFEGETSSWSKERLPIGTWSEITNIDSQVANLETGEVTLEGSENIRGEDCYILHIIPDEEKLINMLLEETRISDEQVPIMTQELFEELIEDITFRQWIRKDTSSIAKAELVMGGEVTPDMLGDSGEGTLAIELTMTLIFYNYNKQVSIQLPTEAEEAISSEGSGFWENGASEQEAKDTELNNIQAAVYAMMVDNELAWLPNPVTVPTDDMNTFPDASATAAGGTGDKDVDPYGNNYELADQDGYYLYQHDITGDAAATGLVNYVTTQTTAYWYSVDVAGTVTQSDTAP